MEVSFARVSGTLNSRIFKQQQKAISVLFQSPKFQSAKPFLQKGVLFAREENRKSQYFHFEGFAIALVLKQRFFVTQKWPKSFRRPLCRPVIPSIFVSVSHVNSINYVLSTYTYLYNHSLSRKFVRIAYLSG